MDASVAQPGRDAAPRAGDAAPPCSCDDGFECTVDRCDATGTCIHEPHDELCAASTCGNPFCDSTVGCAAVPSLPDGTLCGPPAPLGGPPPRCRAGACLPGRVTAMDLVGSIAVPTNDQWNGNGLSRPRRLSDIDGDGLDDLAVRAKHPLDDGLLTSLRGAVLAYSLASYDLLWEADGTGDEEDGWFGGGVETVGDLDGDGAVDLATSEVVETVGQFVALSGATGEEIWRYAEPGGDFPTLEPAGDVDSDGTPDLLGEHLRYENDMATSGIHLISGLDGQPFLSRLSENVPDFDFPVDYFHPVGAAPDLDGDGLEDMVANDFHFFEVGDRHDVVLVLSSASLETVRTFDEGLEGIRACSRIGDVDSDGTDDFAFVMYPTRRSSRLYATNLASGEYVWTVDGFGCQTVTYDLDGDGVRDLVGAVGFGIEYPPTNSPFTALSGADGSVLFQVPLTEAQEHVRVGADVAQVSDLNGDGAEDWAVSGGGAYPSRIWIYVSRVEY